MKLLATTLAGLLGLGGCLGLSTGRGDRLDALHEARDRWQTAAISDYRQTYTMAGAWVRLEVTVEVHDGRITSSSTAAQRAPHNGPAPSEGLSVIDMFETLEFEAHEADALAVDYDPATGRPTRYSVDPSERAYDDEYTVTVASFTVLA